MQLYATIARYEAIGPFIVWFTDERATVEQDAPHACGGLRILTANHPSFAWQTATDDCNPAGLLCAIIRHTPGMHRRIVDRSTTVSAPPRPRPPEPSEPAEPNDACFVAASATARDSRGRGNAEIADSTTAVPSRRIRPLSNLLRIMWCLGVQVGGPVGPVAPADRRPVQRTVRQTAPQIMLIYV